MTRPTLRSAAELDRMSHKRSDAKWIAELTAAAAARFIVLVDQRPVVISNAERTAATLKWFTKAELSTLGVATGDALFLGIEREGGAGRFAVPISEHIAKLTPAAVEAFRPYVDLRTLAMQGQLTPEELSLAGQAKALVAWHEDTRCCGHCGGTNQVKDGGWKRKCWACGKEHFPRTDPVVIMLVVDRAGDRCLLGHEARFGEKMFSTLAGFIEPGEDIEHAVRRETFEEAGIEVGEVAFHSAQPWPFPHSLMIGCIAEARTTELNIDPNEIVEARWFPRADAAMMLEGRHPEGLWVPGKQAIARALIAAFVKGEA